MSQDNLEAEILELLERMTQDYLDEAEEIMEAVAKEATHMLKRAYKHSNNPNTNRKATGMYNKGWRLTRQKLRGKKEVFMYVIHNKSNYWLTHLLEHGHINKMTGERVNGKVHIKQIEDDMLEDAIQRMQNIGVE